MRPLLLIEINEVSSKTLDLYLQKPGYNSLKKLFNKAKRYSTYATDEGELSPWITWPSFHRGIPAKEHGISHLGQDPATFSGKAIWDELLERKASVGIFGSLQSWPPRDPGPGGFYVPDTFAKDERCFPPRMNAVQKFNLGQVRENGRVIQGGLWATLSKAGSLFSLLNNGVSLKSALRILAHVLSEQLSADEKPKRVSFQTMIFWDCFRNLYNPSNPPAFSTFFTNHIASLQHRYWHKLFPEDHGLPSSKANTSLFDHAFSVLDEICRDLLVFHETNPDLTIVLANSMSQGPVSRLDHHGTELVLKEPGSLFSQLGLGPEKYEPLLAMTPQIAVRIPDEQTRESVKDALHSIRSASGERVFSVSGQGESLSITTKTPSQDDCTAAILKFGSTTLTFSDLGIVALKVEPGTAYHLPEGFFYVVPGTNSLAALPKDKNFPATEAKKMLLGLMGEAP